MKSNHDSSPRKTFPSVFRVLRMRPFKTHPSVRCFAPSDSDIYFHENKIKLPLLYSSLFVDMFYFALLTLTRKTDGFDLTAS